MFQQHDHSQSFTDRQDLIRNKIDAVCAEVPGKARSLLYLQWNFTLVSDRLPLFREIHGKSFVMTTLLRTEKSAETIIFSDTQVHKEVAL
jgi:hypothetical protein